MIYLFVCLYLHIYISTYHIYISTYLHIPMTTIAWTRDVPKKPPQDTYVGLESQGVVTIRNDSEVPIDFRHAKSWWRNRGLLDFFGHLWWFTGIGLFHEWEWKEDVFFFSAGFHIWFAWDLLCQDFFDTGLMNLRNAKTKLWDLSPLILWLYVYIYIYTYIYRYVLYTIVGIWWPAMMELLWDTLINYGMLVNDYNLLK